MAPTSPERPPPGDCPNTAAPNGLDSAAARREIPQTLEADGEGWAGLDPDEHAKAGFEVYGPLGIERRVKGDGRALILYTRREDRDG